MKIYIASSWKNQHAVELLTAQLRERGNEVVSWIENNYGEDHGPNTCVNFEEWVRTPAAKRAFHFDVNGAMESDLVIYVGPAGTDAWAEVGAAYGSGVPIVGLWAKGEPSGLMRHMMDCWHVRVEQLLRHVVGLQALKGEEASQLSPGDGITLADVEKIAIRRTLAMTDGHRGKAAEILNIGVRTIYRKITEYGL